MTPDVTVAVLGGTGPLDSRLAASDQDEDERHETGSEQADDGGQGAWVVH